MSFASAAGIAVLIAAAGCGSSASTAAGPSPIKCQVSLTGAPTAVQSSGGSGTVTVAAQPECSWTAAAEAAWIADLSPLSGQGGGAIQFRVPPNPLPSPRQGSIVVNDHRVSISQEAAACQFEISPQTLSTDAAAGSASVAVSATSGCAWTASSEVPWIVIASGSAAGNGSGTVGLSFTANSGGERTGAVVVAGHTFTLTQAAAGSTPAPVGPCAYQISPAAHAIDALGGSGPVEVLTNAGCQWTAVSNVPWITITSGANGSGRGVVGVQVAPNSGANRTGTAQIAGQTLTITQAAATPPSCSYTVSPTSQSVGYTAGAGTPLAVQTTNNCSWSASSQATWVTIVEGANGSGSGTVRISVAENTGAERTGSLTIAGRTVTLTQAAAPPPAAPTPPPTAPTPPPTSPEPSPPPAPTPCTFVVNPTSHAVASSGGNGTSSLVTGATCDWTAQSQTSWLSISSPSSGRGNASIAFTAAANSGGSRTGTFAIAGQTVTVTQAAAPAPNCTFALSPQAASVAAGSGSTSFTVSSATGCTWTATPNDAWLTLSGSANGSGNGTVNLTIAANTGPARSGTVSVAGQTFTVNQAAAPAPVCSYALSPQSVSVGADTGTTSFNVSSPAGCTWSVTASAGWLKVTSGSSGSGNGTINVSVAANTGSARSGSVTVAGQAFTVNQAAAPAPVCTYALSPQSVSVGAAAGTTSFNMSSPAGCAWSVTASAGWLTVTSGTSGTGNGTINLDVAPNTGAARSGSVTVGGQAFTVTQAAPPVCAPVVTPTSASVPASGATGNSVGVVVLPGCTWTAATPDSWITITAGANGSPLGTGTVTYNVAANSGAARTGTLTVAGQTVTINQAAAACSYTINPSSDTLNAKAADLSVNVTTSGWCAWTAQSHASWITIQSSASGTGNGTVQLRIAANGGSNERIGTVTIAGRTFTVTQRGGD